MHEATMNRRLLIPTVTAILLVLGPAAAVPQGIEEHFLNSAALITNGKSGGSGFFMLHELARDLATGRASYAVLLVTNKHLLPPETATTSEPGPRDISVRLVVRKDDDTAEVKDVSVPVVGPDGKWLKSVAYHPAPLVDVAVVDVGNVLNEQRANLFFQVAQSRKAVTSELLVHKDELKEAAIGIGTQIYLLGYPAGIFERRNISPILRVGIIATEPDRDFAFNDQLRAAHKELPETLRGFLIDASVFPGSSGSMVVRRTDIVPGFSPGGKRSIPYILGIVSGSLPIYDLEHVQRMGLGIVYNAETIRETIEVLLKQRRVVTP